MSFSSCNTLKIYTIQPYKKNDKIKEIALMPVVIGKIDQPIFPLIDAAMFNKKTNKIADTITVEAQMMIDTFRYALAQYMTEYFGVKVWYGKELSMKEGYANITHLAESLDTKNEHFPSLILAEGDKMPFQIKKGDVEDGLDSEKAEMIAKEVCSHLNVDALAISFTHLSVISAGGFGLSGNVVLFTEIIMFDKNGIPLSSGYAQGKYTTINGKYIYEYRNKLKEFPFLNEILVKDMAGIKYTKK